MEPVHTFYKDLPADENSIFVANLTEKNELEEVKFKKSREYAISELSINQDIGTDFIAVRETDRQEVLSKLIQKLVNERREPYLFIRIFNEEAIEKIIPFERIGSKEVPFIEYTFYNTTTKKKTRNSWLLQLPTSSWKIFVYCENVHRQEKTNKKNDNGKKTRKLLFLGEPRVSNISVSIIDRTRLISYMLGYFYTDRTIETIYPNGIPNFRSLTNLQKGRDMRRISSISPDITEGVVFYSSQLKPTTVLHVQPLAKINLIEARLAHLLVPQYYHDRRDSGFMKNLYYQGKVFSRRSDHVNKCIYQLDRVLYIYISTSLSTSILSESEINWNFPTSTLKHLDYQ